MEYFSVKLLTIYTFVTIVYWCSLNFLTAKRHIGVRQVCTARIESTSPRKKPTEVYDPLYKSVHIGKVNKEVVAIKEFNASSMKESDSTFLEEVS